MSIAASEVAFDFGDIVPTKKARASTSRSSGRLFSRNSDYEEVEGEKHPPVIQPVAPLIVKPDITNHLLSNAYSSCPEPCGKTHSRQRNYSRAASGTLVSGQNLFYRIVIFDSGQANVESLKFG